MTRWRSEHMKAFLKSNPILICLGLLIAATGFTLLISRVDDEPAQPKFTRHKKSEHTAANAYVPRETVSSDYIRRYQPEATQPDKQQAAALSRANVSSVVSVLKDPAIADNPQAKAMLIKSLKSNSELAAEVIRQETYQNLAPATRAILNEALMELNR